LYACADLPAGASLSTSLPADLSADLPASLRTFPVLLPAGEPVRSLCGERWDASDHDARSCDDHSACDADSARDPNAAGDADTGRQHQRADVAVSEHFASPPIEAQGLLSLGFFLANGTVVPFNGLKGLQ
jgi:hypothetical protein